MNIQSLITGIVMIGVSGAVAWAQDGTTETSVQVRVVARDAKLMGDVVGGARVTITEIATGRILVEA